MLAVLLTACSGPEGGALPSATQTVIPATATVTAAPPPTRAPTVTPAPAPPPTATATPTARPSATPRTGEIATSVTPRATTARPTPAPTRTPPPVASPATLTTEGVQRTGAAAWHEAGWTGKGVRVGVIDTTFNDYTKYLTGKVTARSFRADGLIEDPEDEEGRHGTACAEIVRAMAPDAELLLAAAGNGSRSFRAAVEWLVETEHVPIISLSYGPTGYPIDDTSVYAQIVDRARDAGTLFIVAAGNDGAGGIGSRTWQGHYGATYADADKDGAHDFVPPDAKSPANGVQVRVRSEPVEIVLNWDDWVQPQVNMSLALYDAAGTEVARADTPLSRRNTEPVQYLQGKFAPGTYTLRVRKRDAADPDLAFDIHFLGAQFAQTTPERSIEVPADARGALAVGESDWETDRVYPTSGRGPTRDGRAKPELVAPACVTSATFDGDEFCGTSAAAPHVAGAAALIRQAMPAATANDLLAFLTQHAAPLTGPDADPNTGGAGRLALGLPPPKP